ncbi:MAG: OmpH family outer membrane protein [Rhodospirillaceae bacterium]
MILRNLRWAAGALALVFVLVAAPVAGARAELKVGIVAFQMVMHESSAGKAIQQAIQASEEAFKKDMTGRREKLQQAEQELVRQQGSVSAEAFAKKREEFLRKAGEFDRDVQAHRKALEQGVDEASRTIQAAAIEIVAGLARDHETSVVLDRAQVIFVDPALDLTREVLEKLNAKLPTVQVKIPPAKK